jgi:hypothetical protein
MMTFSGCPSSKPKRGRLVIEPKHPLTKSNDTIALGYLAAQESHKTQSFGAPDLVLILEASQLQGRYRLAMHRAVNAYKGQIIDEIGSPPTSWRAGRPVLLGSGATLRTRARTSKHPNS